jgi:hypothetical protein
MKHTQYILLFHYKNMIKIYKWQFYSAVASSEVDETYFSILHKQLLIMSKKLMISCSRVRAKKNG